MNNFGFTNIANNLELIRPFGPTIAKVTMPNNLIEKLNNYVDQVTTDIGAMKKLDHGKELAGNVKQEFIIDKKFEFQKYFFNFLKSIT